MFLLCSTLDNRENNDKVDGGKKRSFSDGESERKYIDSPESIVW